METHLLLIGAGHAHLSILKDLPNLQMQGHSVTVISAGAYHYYSGMGPGLLAGTYRPEDARVHVQRMVEESGGIFLRDTVTRLNPAENYVETAAGQQVHYEVASCNVGSEIPTLPEMTPGDAVFSVKPIEHLLKARAKILKLLEQRDHITLTVAGGGAAGVEIAANLRALVAEAPGQAAIHLIAGERLLARFPKRVRQYALETLTGQQINVREGVRAERVSQGTIELSDGASFASDVCLLATGTRPPRLFVDSGLSTADDGGLPVNAYLQSPEFPNLFGGGDCISFQPQPLDRVGVYAVRQNPVLLHNTLAALNQERLEAFTPQKNYMLILNMGDGTAIVHRHPCILRGKPFFWLKNFIDTAFMRKFQISGEREEGEEGE